MKQHQDTHNSVMALRGSLWVRFAGRVNLLEFREGGGAGRQRLSLEQLEARLRGELTRARRTDPQESGLTLGGVNK
jgi:hypothetical protein